MVYDTNAYLTQDQMTVNAQYILDYLTGKGWTKNAVCGLLGNAQTESTINFGIWQSLDSSNPNNGFGLLQWTPSTKYTDWATSNNYYDDTVGELERILYEVSQNIQWINSTMTFQDFTKSTDTPENLAQLFLTSYERPANEDQPDRQTQARYWFDNLSGGGTVSTPTNKTLIPLFLAGTMKVW